ncbi:MAG TPA: flagellar basal-body protein, partial [Azospirillaceae bacterium]|nr:flagellar basal-body protein [Azospirillaceae bacterium]
MDKLDIRYRPAPPAAKPTGLPKNALERAQALVGLMERLAVCLDREADAIRRRRPLAEIRALVKEKEPMMLVYEEISRLLRVDAEGVAALPAELKAQLKAATLRLKTAGDAGAETLRAASAGQKLLVDTAAAAISRANQSRTTAYDATAG